MREKVVQALRYKSKSFQLVNGDVKTILNRDDLYKILELLDKNNSTKRNEREYSNKFDNNV